MLDLHWMRERVVSNEFRRDRLAVLRGGAEMKGDAWPDAADARVAVAHSLPRWFAARLIEERGEAGAIANLDATFLLADSINHGINLKRSPALQYLYCAQPTLAPLPLF